MGVEKNWRVERMMDDKEMVRRIRKTIMKKGGTRKRGEINSWKREKEKHSKMGERVSEKEGKRERKMVEEKEY